MNPNTVARAYRELESEGFIVSKRGVGSFPAAAPPTKLPDKKRVLRAIYQQAIAEAARYRISPDEMVETFRRMLCAT